MAPYETVDVSRFNYGPGSYVSTPTIQKIDLDPPSDMFPGHDFVFSCDALRGAVLTLPDGAHLEKLDNLENMRAYAARHADSWYKYVNGARGRGLANGDLCLVTGCEKTRSWGMASYHTGREEFKLAFKRTVRPETSYKPYHWSGTHGQKNSARRKSYGPPTTNAPVNQATFIHGWSISLPTGLWCRLFGTVETASIVDFQLRFNVTGGSPQSSPQGSRFSLSLFGATGETGGNRCAGEHGEVVLSDLSLIAKILDPAKLINAYILYKVPQATVVMSHDNDWSDILGDDSDITSASEFLQQIDDKFTITERHGATFLVSKLTSSESSSPDNIPALPTLKSPVETSSPKPNEFQIFGTEFARLQLDPQSNSSARKDREMTGNAWRQLPPEEERRYNLTVQAREEYPPSHPNGIHYRPAFRSNWDVLLEIAPSDTLRRVAVRIYARLDLIIEFRPWLQYIKRTKHTTSHFNLLWETCALGASLVTLLDLLGSPSPKDLSIDAEKPELRLQHCEIYFTNFINRVQQLELQGKIPFGKALQVVEDLFGRTSSGFAKVLETIERVLDVLQTSYPGLYVLPNNSAFLREGYIQELLETEQAHIIALGMTGDSAEFLSEGMPINPCLGCLVVNCPLLRQYHERVLGLLEDTTKTALKEDWDQIFAFEDEAGKNSRRAYRSICANYLNLVDFMHGYFNNSSSPLAYSHAQILLNYVSQLLIRSSTYTYLLGKILSVTSPAESSTYDALCNAVFHLQEASENLDDLGLLIRTIYCTRIFKDRAFNWRADIDPSELGPLFLDDRLGVPTLVDLSGRQMQYSVFLFETMLLCCTEGVDMWQEDEEPYPYPVRAWELGPALKQVTPLNLVHAIPTSRMKILLLSDSNTFELEWVDEANSPRTLKFCTTSPKQFDQWCSAFEMFTPSVHNLQHPPDSARSSVEGRDDILSTSEDVLDAGGSPLMPKILPRLFGPGSPDVSPLGATFSRGYLGTNEAVGGLCFNIPPPTPPPDSKPYVEADPPILLDLTGQISYPQAHGGFAGVWKGVWDRQPERWVAIKVLRSRPNDDPQIERKMNENLAHKLGVWKCLDHKHVLKLLGTVSGFGPYVSMVCPWLEQGSVSKYMERRGDILSMTDRLQLLCEVADGLNYLHENSIVHGNLAGSNILIDDEGKAKLCDFSLSNIDDGWIGGLGAVRWADASLYTLSTDDDEAQTLTTPSDIYSFGSVMLEILCGRIPYHYIEYDTQVLIEISMGNKPRRPALSFVMDAQWEFIQRCWAANHEERPHCAEVVHALKALHATSLEFRRHTY